MSASIWWVWVTETLVTGSLSMAATAQDLSPLQTVELLHKAMAQADAATAAALLHADYRGVSLQGASEQRHVYVETRDKAVRDIAALHAGDWQIASSRRAPGSIQTEWLMSGPDTSSTTRARRITAVTNPTACFTIAGLGRSSASLTPTMC